MLFRSNAVSEVDNHDEPIVGFDSDGEPVSVGEEEEFATPSTSENFGEGVSQSTRQSNFQPRRRYTYPHRTVEPFPTGLRLKAALDRVRQLKFATTEPLSAESLLWDTSAQELQDPLEKARLWSASTGSTHFDVPVSPISNMEAKIGRAHV